MLLTLIICTYKRPELLSKCIKCALPVLNELDAELIVINDDKNSNIEVPNLKNVKLINNPKQGLASVRNLGAANANGKLLLFIDDDIEFTIKNVVDLLQHYQLNDPACYNPNWKYSDEMLQLVNRSSFGRFIIKNGLIDYKGWVPNLNWQNKLFETSVLAGFFMLIPKEFFLRSGGFNETFINQGTEDDELCMRLKKQNTKMFICPEIYVHHNEIDRISLESRLARYYNGAINRRRAFDLGHQTYQIKYNKTKQFLISILLPFYNTLIGFSKLIPNQIAFDFLYFKLAHTLIALAIYKGYNKK
ncbi:MAG: glycosyltransferase family 2 protein [Sphingobacteriaceae bacterium]